MKVRKGKQAGATVVNLPQLDQGRSRDKAGKALGVSGTLVDHATKVLKNAVPEVIKAVDEGRIAVSTAAILASEPEEVQRHAAAEPKRRRSTNRSVFDQPDPPAGKKGRGKKT